MNTNNLITAIKAEPLTRMCYTTYDKALVESVREDIIKLIQRLDSILAENVA
jgi:hypothetical protein